MAHWTRAGMMKVKHFTLLVSKRITISSLEKEGYYWSFWYKNKLLEYGFKKSMNIAKREAEVQFSAMIRDTFKKHKVKFPIGVLNRRRKRNEERIQKLTAMVQVKTELDTKNQQTIDNNREASC